METETKVPSLMQFALDVTTKIFLEDPDRILAVTKIPTHVKIEVAEHCRSALVAFRKDCNHVLKRKHTYNALVPVLTAKEHIRIPIKFKDKKNMLSFRKLINDNLPSPKEKAALEHLTRIINELEK
jgi:hypothetical protein